MASVKTEHGLISTNLRRLRGLAGLSQQGLVDRSGGVSIATLKNLERGANQNPETATLESLARALGVSVADLFRKPRRRA